MDIIRKLKPIALLFFLVSLPSCKSWLMFDMSRLAISFILTLVIGFVGLIIMIFNRNNNK